MKFKITFKKKELKEKEFTVQQLVDYLNNYNYPVIEEGKDHFIISSLQSGDTIYWELRRIFNIEFGVTFIKPE